MGATIDIDVGGTFTDCFVRHDGRIVTAKVPTTHYDLSVCFRKVIESSAEKAGLDLAGLLGDAELIRYSTTIGINSLIERTGPPLGLITTRGFEDTIFIGRSRQWADGIPVSQTRDLSQIEKPAPLLDTSMVVGVRERVDCFGNVLMPLDPDDVREQLQTLVDRGARGFVVSLLWSFLNPAHELAVRDIIRSEYPDVYLGNVPVVCSHQISPRGGEYARTMTAVVDAYTHRQISGQLWTVGEMVRDAGYDRPLSLVHNNGGSKKVTRTRAIDTHGAGPVAGVLGSAHLARAYGLDRVVFTDVGGTSFDLGVVIDGQVSSYEFRPVLDRWRVQGSFVETRSIGAGGGSVARVDTALGRLHVGPESAGSLPGPACYGLGGDRPTVTDADLVLGLLDADNYLGGRMRLDPDAARDAIEEHVAEPLGVDVDEAAWQIRRLVDATMGQEIFKELALKGHNPRQFTIFAAGGAGATHAAGYAEAVGASTVYTFPFSSVFCAFGASTADVLHIYEQTRHLTVTQFLQPGFALDRETFNRTVAELVAQAQDDFALEGFPAQRLRYSLELDMRYKTQLNQTRVEVPKLELTGEADVAELCAAFDAAYARHYSAEAAFPAAGVDIEEFHLKAWVPSGHPPPARQAERPGDGAQARTGSREVYWGPGEGRVPTPVYDRTALEPGDVMAGPAVIESDDTTTVVPRPWTYRVDSFGNGVLTREAAAGQVSAVPGAGAAEGAGR